VEDTIKETAVAEGSDYQSMQVAVYLKQCEDRILQRKILKFIATA
jgi:hypothetical protein